MLENEILKRAIADGIIDLPTIQRKVEMNERQKYLDLHEHKIWQGGDYWYTYLRDLSGKRKLVKRKSRRDLEDMLIDIYKNSENDVTTSDCFNMWIERKYEFKEISKQTYNRYKNDYKRFIEHSTIDCKIKYITEEDLEIYIRTNIRDNGLTAKAWSNLRTLLYGIFKTARKLGQTDIVITVFMKEIELSPRAFKRVRKTKKQQVFSDHEMKMVYDYIIQNDRSCSGLGILFSFYTGMRAGEISSLKWSDIDNNCIHVERTEISYKGDEKMIYEVSDFPKTDAGYRDVILTNKVRYILDMIKEVSHGEWVFVDEDGKRIHGYVFSNKLRRICVRLGIVAKSLHKCRKTYATILSNANIPDAVITNQIGHSDIATTRRYYIFDNYEDDETIDLIQAAFE